MEQEPTPIIELLVLILFLGSITFLLGAIFQGYVLYKNKKSFLTSISVIILTRLLTIISSYFIWAFWHLPIDIMFLFFYLPAILPELIFSPLILKVFGNELIKMIAVAYQSIELMAGKVVTSSLEHLSNLLQTYRRDQTN